MRPRAVLLLVLPPLSLTGCGRGASPAAPGVIVEQAAPDGAAATAGLRAGDVLLRWESPGPGGTRRGTFVDPHKIMALSLKYLVEKRGWSGAVVRTVSTTRMIDRLATGYGLKLYETPVGFNHIADYMMTEDVLIGGEESGGISFKGHIPEGDGPIMGLLLVEMVAESGKTLQRLVDDLLTEVGPALYERTDLRLSRPVAKAEMTEFLINQAPNEIGDQKVEFISRREGVKYIMADDSWLLIRPSGTEPVLRVYAEGRTHEMVKALLGYGEQVAESVV